METNPQVVIAGEGITGLAIAHWLRKESVRVLVLAKGQEPGGTMRSVRGEGFLREIGPNSALETSPLFKELVADLGLQDEFLYASPSGRNRYILKNGVPTSLPLGPGAFLATSLFSWSAKIRLLKEPFIGRATREESVEEFVTRRLGREFHDYAIDPFVAGVFAGRTDRLSVRSAFPKLYALETEYGGLIRGMIGGARERRKREEKAKDRAETFAFRSGMQTLPRAIASSLGNDILFETPLTTLHESPGSETGRYRLEARQGDRTLEIRTEMVVIAVPAYEASRLVRPLSAEAAAALDSIYYPPVVSISLGFRRQDVGHPLDGFGYLIPTAERRKILGCLWNSSLFPGRAPEGCVAVNAFVGGSRQPELTALSDNELLALTLEELGSAMQIQGKPVYWNATRWEKAIPQYELGHQAKLDVLLRVEREHPGLILAGNYRGGISVGDCVLSARRIAGELAARLRFGAPATLSQS